MGPKDKKRTGKPFPKGRQASDADIAAVRALVGDVEPGRDQLIEHLHTLNDHYGYLSTGHIAALAHLLGLAQIDVYETATFYAHFEVGDTRSEERRVGQECRSRWSQ